MATLFDGGLYPDCVRCGYQWQLERVCRNANGTVERSFVFKQDGSKLTGETSSVRFGTSKIEDGKVEGDDVSFQLTINVGGSEGKVIYKGKVEGDTIKFKVEIQAVNQTIDFVAKRVP